jgi:hypothetical protein
MPRRHSTAAIAVGSPVAPNPGTTIVSAASFDQDQSMVKTRKSWARHAREGLRAVKKKLGRSCGPSLEGEDDGGYVPMTAANLLRGWRQ